MPVDVFPFTPGRSPGLGQPGACAVLMPVKFCRPVPGDRLDERTAGRHVCHMCVICVSCLCHKCVIYEQKFNFSAGRPPDRRKAKKKPVWIFMLYNIKIKKTAPTRPRASRAPHARMRKIIYTTTYCCIYILDSPPFVKFFVQFVAMCSEMCPKLFIIYIYIYYNGPHLTTF